MILPIRLLLCTLGMLLTAVLQAQVNPPQIERFVLSVPSDSSRDIATLTHFLVAPYPDKTDQVSAIFAWIIHHIDYDKIAYKLGQKRINRSAEDVLKRREAVCLGYAQLFAQMCATAGINSQIIEGYSKNTRTAQPALKLPDHAWNAVQIEDKWYLLDATWGASFVKQDNAFSSKADVLYFLTPPEAFVLDHLPGDPIWQLLDCPVPADVFKGSSSDIRKYLDQGPTDCMNYSDSIRAQLRLPFRQRRLAFYENTYTFNPTPENRQQLGQAYLDLGGELADIAEALQDSNQLDSLAVVHAQLLETFRTAKQYTTLYDWQEGLYINTLINRAVAISRTLSDSKSRKQYVDRLKNMQVLLNEALFLLDEQKPSLLQLQQTSQAQEYLDWVEDMLKTYRK